MGIFLFGTTKRPLNPLRYHLDDLPSRLLSADGIRLQRDRTARQSRIRYRVEEQVGLGVGRLSDERRRDTLELEASMIVKREAATYGKDPTGE